MFCRFRHLFILAMLFVCPGLPALAATPVYYVDAARPDNSGDGLSWAAAKKSIQTAIDATVAPHQVWVKAGTYLEAIILHSGVALYGGFSYNATLVTDRDPQSHPTVINGTWARGGLPAWHVVTMHGVQNVELNGFVITGGVAAGTAFDELDHRNHGAGIYCKDLTGTNQVSDCVLQGNKASIFGGGLYSLESALTVRNCTVQQNQAWQGAGLYCYRGVVEIANCAVLANLAEDAAGIFGEMGYLNSSLRIHECTIAANRAEQGSSYSNNMSAGGIYLSGWSSSSIEVANSLIVGNVSWGAGGVLVNTGLARLVHCTIANNTSLMDQGGGLTCFGDTHPECYNCIFAGNQPYSVYESYTGQNPKVVNCLFYSDASALGDYYYDGKTALRGATAINAIPGGQASQNIDGPPQLVMSPNQTWTKNSTYDTTLNRATFTNARAKWRPGELAGRLIVPDLTQKELGLVLDNTTTTIVATGLPWGFSASAGAKWQFADFRTGCGSPAIDNGLSAFPYVQNVDLLGRARPFNIPGFGSESGASAYDIGAYEAVIDPARVRVNPDGDTIDFGTVDIIDGPTPPRSITITNIGFTPLTFSAPAFRLIGDAADFTTTTNMASTPLSPGAVRTLNFAFDPATTGTKTASLLIATNDSERPVTTVTLTGKGIIPQPVFTRYPSSRMVDPGTSATFSAAATGRAPLTYQWLFNGQPLVNGPRISGAQTTTLTLTGITQADKGAYSCVVTTPVGSATSLPAYLNFYPHIHIVSPYGTTTPPAGDYICRTYSFPVTMNTPAVAGPIQGMQYACTGWTTTGGKYGNSGSWMTATLCPSEDTTLTWTWKTQYYLATAASPAGFGTVIPAPGWYDAGRTVPVIARPSLWCALQGWSGSMSATDPLLQVMMNAPQTLTANFSPLPGVQGVVNINVWPPTTAWSLRDNKGRLVQRGSGKARIAGVPFGSVTLAWVVPAGYDATAANPVTQLLTPSGEVSFVEVLRPSADTKERKVGNILRYLLGLTTDPAGLDQNGDAKVSIADMLQANK